MRDTRGREAKAIAVAALLHAALLLVAATRPGAEPPHPNEPAPPVIEIDLEPRAGIAADHTLAPRGEGPQRKPIVEGIREITVRAPRGRTGQGADARGGTELARAGSAPGRAVEVERAEASPGETAPPSDPSPKQRAAPADDYGPLTAGADAVPGLDGAPVWALPGATEAGRAGAAPASPVRVDRDIAGKVLTGTLRKRDAELGVEMPAAGAVASALADAVRSAPLHEEARASFEVDLGPGGEVRGVRVKSFSAGNADGWDRVARRAASSLSGRALAGSGEPVTVVVATETRQRYPAGTREKYDAQPVCANEIIEDVAGELAATVNELGGEARDDRPRPPRPATLDPRRRFCIPVGVGVTGDLSNIGAHRTTVVRSTFHVVRASAPNMPSDRARTVDDRAPWLPAREGTAPKSTKEKKPPPPPSLFEKGAMNTAGAAGDRRAC